MLIQSNNPNGFLKSFLFLTENCEDTLQHVYFDVCVVKLFSSVYVCHKKSCQNSFYSDLWIIYTNTLCCFCCCSSQSQNPTHWLRHRHLCFAFTSLHGKNVLIIKKTKRNVRNNAKILVTVCLICFMFSNFIHGTL